MEALRAPHQTLRRLQGEGPFAGALPSRPSPRGAHLPSNGLGEVADAVAVDVIVTRVARPVVVEIRLLWIRGNRALQLVTASSCAFVIPANTPTGPPASEWANAARAAKFIVPM